MEKNGSCPLWFSHKTFKTSLLLLEFRTLNIVLEAIFHTFPLQLPTTRRGKEKEKKQAVSFQEWCLSVSEAAHTLHVSRQHDY